jgi:3-oxoacyl-[acyl-carrier protein] reductase
MMMNKKAVISGATRGMGRAIAMRLGSEGYDLAVSARSERDLEDFKAEVSEKNKNIEVLIYACDLSHPDEAKSFADFIQTRWKRVDVLVNNAGTFVEGGITDAGENVLEQMMALNFYSAYHLTRNLCKPMQEAKSGHIFNTCSIASKEIVKGASLYSISKHAMYAFSNGLREELRKDFVKVTSILPGSTFTSSWEDESLKPSLVQVEDIASSVLLALSMSAAACVEEIIIKPIQFRS